MYALLATEYEHLNFAKTRTAANFIGKDTAGVFTMLNSISNVIHAKSSDISQKHPAANNDAITCKKLIQYNIKKYIQGSLTKIIRAQKKRQLGECHNVIKLHYNVKKAIHCPIIVNSPKYNLTHNDVFG